MTTNTPIEYDLLHKLAKFASVMFDILDQIQRRQESHWLSISQSDVAMWERRGNTRRSLCSEIARCADIHGRRRRYCRKLKWIAAREKAARSRPTAAQAQVQACQPQCEPTNAPTTHKKKGRTDVRP